MNSADKYITNEYKALLHNATVILSIVLFAIIGINAILAIIAPSWTIRLFVSIGLIMSVGSVWLLYTSIKHFIDYRDHLVIIKWDWCISMSFNWAIACNAIYLSKFRLDTLIQLR